MMTAIVAMDQGRVIGADGKLPWHLPEDLAFFKKTTYGHTVVMGRKTFAAIGKPLPGRSNYVLTRNPQWHEPGTTRLSCPEAVAELSGEVFVIGGAQVYMALMPWIERWLISHVKGYHSGDTILPPFEDEFPLRQEHACFANFTVVSYSRLRSPSELRG